MSDARMELAELENHMMTAWQKREEIDLQIADLETQLSGWRERRLAEHKKFLDTCEQMGKCSAKILIRG